MKTGSMSVGTFEAKNRFSEIIDRVSRGAEITITRHDKPVARIIPATPATAAQRKRAVAGLRQIRGNYDLAGTSPKELIADGRR